jgi:hypothetical protein
MSETVPEQLNGKMPGMFAMLADDRGGSLIAYGLFAAMALAVLVVDAVRLA